MNDTHTRARAALIFPMATAGVELHGGELGARGRARSERGTGNWRADSAVYRQSAQFHLARHAASREVERAQAEARLTEVT